MRGLFNPDGDFAHAMNWIGRIIWLNFLFLLGVLPIVTAGVSYAALYACLQKMQQGYEGKLTKLFFDAFGENFKTATVSWLILLSAIVLCLVDFLVVPAGFWRVLAVGGLQVCAMVMVLMFPLIARYDNRPLQHLKNALLLALGNLPRVLCIFVLWGVPIGACLKWGVALHVLSILWLLLGFAALSWLNQKLLWPIFRAIDESGIVE